MNRLGVYFLFDKDGLVEEQVVYYLKNLKPYLSKLAVVVNGFVDDAGVDKLNEAADLLLIRENKGFDSHAYKAVFEHLGYDELKTYDEVLTCNFTCYGPFFPFSDMFGKMAKSECDFWGACRHTRIDNIKLSKKQKTSYLPEHIMSYFMVYKKSLLSSPEFKKYWDNLPPIKTYEEAIVFHEAVFTEHFESLGFKSDTYVDKKYAGSIYENPSIFNAYGILKDAKCPVVKRKMFFVPQYIFLKHTRGEQSSRTFAYIKEHTDYNSGYIVDDMLHAAKGASLRNGFNLNCILPEKYAVKELNKKLKTALVLYIDNQAGLEYFIEKSRNMPEKSDLYIFTANSGIAKEAENLFKKAVIENLDGHPFILPTHTKKFAFEYDYICFAASRRYPGFEDEFTNEEFRDHCVEGVLKSREYVINLLGRFEEDKRLGFLSSPSIYFGTFRELLKTYNKENYTKTADYYKEKLGMVLPSFDNVDPCLENSFWFKPAALKNLFETELKDPPLLFENLYQVISQYNGHYYGWAMSDETASIYFNNLFCLYRKRISPKMMRKLTCKKALYSLLTILTFGCKTFKKKRNEVKLEIKKHSINI